MFHAVLSASLSTNQFLFYILNEFFEGSHCIETCVVQKTTKMENGQEETKVETATNDAVDDEVKNEKPVSNVEENAAKQISEEPSTELLERIKTQIEVLLY